MELTKGRLVVAPTSRPDMVDVWLVDEDGCLLHTEPVCRVLTKWHSWFATWLQEGDIPIPPQWSLLEHRPIFPPRDASAKSDKD
jgi:hypothetical protein